MRPYSDYHDSREMLDVCGVTGTVGETLVPSGEKLKYKLTARNLEAIGYACWKDAVFHAAVHTPREACHTSTCDIVLVEV